jgi:hypothetical protein
MKYIRDMWRHCTPSPLKKKITKNTWTWHSPTSYCVCPNIYIVCTCQLLHSTYSTKMVWCSGVPRGGFGCLTPSPPEILKFWQSCANSQSCGKYIHNNLIRIQVSPICKLSRTPWLGGYRPQMPVLSALCPQLNLLNPPPNKIPGYATSMMTVVVVVWVDIKLLPGTMVRKYKTMQVYFPGLIANKHLNNTPKTVTLGHQM